MIEGFLGSQAESSFSYPNIGDTKPENDVSELRAEYTADHNRIVIGNGGADFEKAKEAIRNWKMFDLPGWSCVGQPRQLKRTVWSQY